MAADPWEGLVKAGAGPTPVAEVELATDAGSPLDRRSPPPPLDASAAAASGGPRVHASDLSYERFCLEFMEPNRPVLIEGATEGWAAARDWVLPDGGGVDMAFLERRFGGARVTATDAARRSRGAGPCKQLSLTAYLAWWRRHQRRRRRQGEQQQAEAAAEAAVAAAAAAAGQAAAATAGEEVGGEEEEDDGGLWYCKDWHLSAEFPGYAAYACAPWFADDWLNEWHDARAAAAAAAAGAAGGEQSQQQEQQEQQQQQQQEGAALADYRFVYMGPQGSGTPLHTDVFKSFSWSANVVGRKHWRLLPPQHAHLLLGRGGRDPPWDFSASEDEEEEVAGAAAFPGLPEARRHLVTLVQQPGEALFVPSGWFHTVENLDDCVSINHNWLNGHNVHWAWALLRRERRQAAEAIADCRELSSPAEFEGLVQRNAGANAGLDYAGLGALLRCIAGRSLEALAAAAAAEEAAGEDATAAAAALAEGPCRGRWYHCFRLQRAAAVLRQLLAEQRRIDGEAAAAADAAGGAGEAPFHAVEAAANAACLEAIQERLRALGLPAAV